MKKTAIDTQKAAVLDYMQDKGVITSWEAIKLFGATRLSAIIYKLRKEGHQIRTEMRTSQNRVGNTVNYAMYWLEDGNEKVVFYK